MTNLNPILEKFPKVNVLVIGDVMLDRYWWGNVERISPEAPVPVVRLQKTSLVLGGAANVAANISGLGANAFLVGAIGDDSESKLFKPLLNEIKVRAENLVEIKKYPTTVKTRVVAHNQHVVRIDQENVESLSSENTEKIWKQIEKVFEKIDLVIISDYAKGVVTDSLLTRLIIKCKDSKKLILVDPKGKDYKRYSGASLLTPNRFEAAQSCDLLPDGQKVIEEAGNLLIKNIKVDSVLITQGEYGMTLFRENEKPFHLNALARKVYDVTGAGDTVIASLGVCLASGATLNQSAEIANISAGIVVEEIGTTTISIEKLRNYLNS